MTDVFINSFSKHPHSGCPFCRIAHGQAPALIVQEWPDALAIRPRADEHGRRGCTEGHLLVIPKAHVADFTTDPAVSATVQQRAAELAAQIGGQWNYLTSCGPDATQTFRRGRRPVVDCRFKASKLRAHDSVRQGDPHAAIAGRAA
ncbi:HIT family protein [Streptomyces cacaoi]|uniref:HIT family protein n=1 Tax=Streptomyces cacaoi TaxID=1898 RepID=UPI002626D860|nr:HIT family protein [Streptomyces cacaoi]